MSQAVHAMQSSLESFPQENVSVAREFRLRRSGVRPKVFSGSELCSAMSHQPGTPFWYEVNLYRTVAEDFIVEVKFFQKSEDGRDIFRVAKMASVDDVVEFLEGYDTSDDVQVKVKPDPELSQVDAVIEAHECRLLAIEAKRQFEQIVGDILFDFVQ